MRKLRLGNRDLVTLALSEGVTRLKFEWLKTRQQEDYRC